MPKVTAALLAALVALTLAGCAGTEDDAAGESAAPLVSESAAPGETPEPTEPPTATAAPATVSPEEVTPTDTTARDGQLQYSAYTEPYLAEQGYTLTPEEVLGVGLYACELIAQGQSVEAMTVIEGAPEHINEYVAVTAGYYLCPTD